MTDADRPRTYLVRTFGCQMNEHDSERLEGMLAAEGMEPTTDVSEASVVVLNTCCIRENADNRLYGTLGHLKSEKDRRPDLRIVVGGCLAQKDRDLIQQRAPYVDVVMGTHNVGRLVDLLDAAAEQGPQLEILESTAAEDIATFPSALPVQRHQGWAAWTTIQIGCDNSCAFCIVPAVRGPELSRPFADIVDEITAAAADGVTEVTLLGQNVNSYGRDITSRLRAGTSRWAPAEGAGDAWSAEFESGNARIRPLFADLLRAVGKVEGIRRVRWISPHPKDLRPETIAAMRDTATVCEHLHLPLQSGSNRVLAAMHRGYTAERYLDRLAMARRTVEDLAVSTDIIVGFPGETDADFELTLELAAEAGFDSAFTFVYSPRPGTPAADYTDAMVSADVTSDRMARLRTVVERTSLIGNRNRIGRVEEGLVEGPSKRDPQRLTARTRQNRLVHFDRPVAGLRAGTYVTLSIVDASTTSLRGELVDVVAEPSHRTRLPLAATS